VGFFGLEHPGAESEHRNPDFATITGKVQMTVRRSTSERKAPRRWVAQVTTDSTHPPPGLFLKDAATIARTLASPKVSPKGPGSGMRMLTYFINRGGKNLTAARRLELEKAKKLLSQRIARQKSSKTAGN
jgi:tRNA(adenine34) deaminase